MSTAAGSHGNSRNGRKEETPKTEGFGMPTKVVMPETAHMTAQAWTPATTGT
jgi:hypothetical protein